jgi:hypothetical protein
MVAPEVVRNEESAYLLSNKPVNGLYAFENLVLKTLIENEFLFLPPNHGSVKVKLKERKKRPFD